MLFLSSFSFPLLVPPFLSSPLLFFPFPSFALLFLVTSWSAVLRRSSSPGPSSLLFLSPLLCSTTQKSEISPESFARFPFSPHFCNPRCRERRKKTPAPQLPGNKPERLRFCGTGQICARKNMQKYLVVMKIVRTFALAKRDMLLCGK